MECDITKEQWADFIKVSTSVIEANPEPKFLETVASALSLEILSKYKVGKKITFCFVVDQFVF